MSDTPSPMTRLERDSLGEVEVPADALYGAQTVRGIRNFPITGWLPNPMLVEATVTVKKAAAMTNRQLGQLDGERADAIIQAADEILAGQHREHFRIDPFQAGAGTSHNMNTNEVLANRANEILGTARGSYKPVNPNDHVNMAQSTNDVFPTSMRIAALMDLETFYPAITAMAEAYAEKGREFDHIIKSGRTHMQDAVPIRLGQEFTAYSRVLFKMRDKIERASEALLELNIGATAAGTGLNSDPRYQQAMVANLRALTGFPLQPAEHLVEMTQSQYAMAEVSSALRALALELIRISHDMRFMSSGPQTGIMEIVLPPVQPGSSIMPGKVNPVMFEMLTMVCNQVIGNDTAVALGVSEGQLELNVMMPQLAFSTLFSIDLLKNAMRVVTEFNVRGITANEERARYMVEHSMGLATALNPYIGYANAASVVKEALKTGKPIRDVVLAQGLLPEEELDRILDPRTMTEPGIPGKGAMPVGGGG
ncbi:MAG TPA: aspartate ammonia-lyase [Chloroflexia bacterium]|nr:aspartate ammonia-lyase [Chloroflexia bacterium]